MSSTPVLIILAGGASSRMWPLREKSLIRFGEEPLLLAQLRRYQSLGFNEAYIVGNPTNRADMESIIAQASDEMTLHLAIQEEPRGMGDALLQVARQRDDWQGQPVYVNQVHDIVDESLHTDLLKMYRSNPQGTYVAGIEMGNYFPGGYLVVNDDGHITGIVEKPGAGNEPSRYVNIVAHCYGDAAALWDALEREYARPDKSDDHYERAMDALMKQQPYYLVPYAGRWDALKYPWHVLSIMERMLGEISGQDIAADAYISDKASIVGDVVICSGAKVFPGAAVVGPAYIGKNTIIGNNALVRNSMVLDNCNVGFTTEVARSYVADGCQMHACRVLDSVFAENVNFSAGCTTANLRIDHGVVKSTVKGDRLQTGRDKLGAIVGKDAFIGVDAMTMPGVKIGESAVVGPGTHVYKDVRDRSRVFVQQEIEIIEDED